MNARERKFGRRLSQHRFELLEATPGFVLQTYERGSLKIDVRFGEHYPFYDLASLTKVIFTATALAMSFGRRTLRPDLRVTEIWPGFRHRAVTLQALMTHTAGLPWWLPYYKKMKGPRRPSLRWRSLRPLLERLPRVRPGRAVYSDPDLLVLGQILTIAEGRDLLEIWQSVQELGCMGQLHFNGGGRRLRPRSRYAPTEKCQWRGRILRGEVHDENAWALGGVAPHAGLFGRVEDVASWALALRQIHRGQDLNPLTSAWIHRFTRRQTSVSVGDWGWLFMKPTKGSASCGRYFSSRSFGHTGFTGTSVWLDPVRDRIVILLSNRVHPTRENRQFLSWRPRLHDWVCEILEE